MTRQLCEVSVFLDKVILLEKTKRIGAVFLRILVRKPLVKAGCFRYTRRNIT